MKFKFLAILGIAVMGKKSRKQNAGKIYHWEFAI